MGARFGFYRLATAGVGCSKTGKFQLMFIIKLLFLIVLL